jgi:hypothetical protein
MSGIACAKAPKKKPQQKPVIRFRDLESRRFFRISGDGGQPSDLAKKLARPFTVSGDKKNARYVNSDIPFFVAPETWVVPD